VSNSDASKSDKRSRWALLLWGAALAVALVCFGATWALHHFLLRIEWYPLLMLQGAVYDRGMTSYANNGAHPAMPVAVMGITENTREELRQVPNFLAGGKGELRYRKHERLFHSRVLRNLKKLGADVVVFDMVFDEDEPQADPEFAKAIREHGRVVLAGVDDAGFEKGGLAERTMSFQQPIESLRVAAAGTGAANLPLDSDRAVRRFGWWSIGVHPETLEDTEIPSLAVAAAAVHARKDPGAIIQQELKPSGTFLGKPVVGLGPRTGKFFPSYIRYFGPEGQAAGPYSAVDYAQVFKLGTDPEINEPLLRRQVAGKIILIGDTAAVGQDVHRTPVFSRGTILDSTQQMPGVEIQAHIAQTVLSGLYPREASGPAQALLVLGVCILMGAVTRYVTPVPALGVAFVVATGLVWGSVRLLADGGLWLEPVTALGGLTSSTICGTVLMYLVEHRERMETRRQLSRHVGPGVAAKLAEHEWPDLGGESVEITLLFSDLQGFTSLSEGMTSQELCSLLNRYFGEVIFPVVDRHGGSTDKLMGDGMMAYFGWPMRDADHAARAIKCALEMQEALAAWVRLPENAELPPLKTRVGIHTGEATVGEIGSGARAEFTVIGDVVNVASRLEGMNKEFGSVILISDATRLEAASTLDVPLKSRGVVAVRGRVEPLPVFSVEMEAEAEQDEQAADEELAGRSSSEEAAAVG
jgi:adenylate cyclase